MNKIFKWVLIVSISGFILFVVLVIINALTSGGIFSKRYSKKDLVDNYNKNARSIIEIKNYINAITPAGKHVDIEFDGDRIEIFQIYGQGFQQDNWDIEIHSIKTDSLLIELGWTKLQLEELKKKLEHANCISAKNGNPCKIGFQRSGMGKYYYDVFNGQIPDTLKSHYNDGCYRILFNDSIALEYGGGAVGRQCFEKEN